MISSLWNVGDESSRELMQKFYRRLWLQKEGKLEALRGAQLEMLKRNRITYKGDGLPATWGRRWLPDHPASSSSPKTVAK